jgi:Methyltransferase domain
MGDKYPAASITGIDLSATQAQWVPPNVDFQIDDMEEFWTFRSPFDFIHGKWLAGSVRDWPKLMQQCYNNLSPGGWVEFEDWDYTPRMPNGSTQLPDNYVKRWHTTVIAGCEEKTGALANPGPLLKDLLLNAGFVDVHEHIFKVPIGCWPKDKKLKEIGLFYRVALEDGLDAISLRILTQLLGWQTLEAQALNAQFRTELKSFKFYHQLFVCLHITLIILICTLTKLSHIVYGRKSPELMDLS